jgi:hydrogenase expression/formation protein HypC
MTDRHSLAEPSPAVPTLPTIEPGGASCATEGCITCGDIAVEVTIVRLLPHAMAAVDTGAGEEEVSVALVDARVGDVILVHAGEAITTIRR